MIRLLKILFAIIALLILVAILIAGSLILFVDPNKLKPVLIEEVKKRSNYTLTIDGDLTWSFYPQLGIKVEHMTLRMPNQATAFVDLRGVRVAMGWQQLLEGTKKLQGDVHIAEVKLSNVQAKQAHVGLHWQNNTLMLQPLTASLYSGTLQGVAQIQLLTAEPIWHWQVTLDHIQLKPLLRDVNGTDSKIQINGIAQVKFQANTQGNTKTQLLTYLNGDVVYNVQHGVLEGVDFNYLLQSADALLSKQPLTLPANLNQTAFENFAGTTIIKNGLAKDNFLLSAAAFTVKGEGTVNLLDETLDYQLQLMPLNMAALKWPVPILIDGNLAHPKIGLDTTKLKTLLMQEQLEQVQQKAQEHIKQLPAKVDKFLKNILKQ
ncbi:MAG TPA: AsmA family protein [Gammaproteobacteria bacterium]|jgi:uncharacterized protein involved in outer membrane biogenesis|nr:AsmA family protein [Gammaproteobacteria bacterium]